MSKLNFEQMKSQGVSQLLPGQFILPLVDRTPSPRLPEPKESGPCVIVEIREDGSDKQFGAVYAVISLAGEGLTLNREEFLVISEKQAQDLIEGQPPAQVAALPAGSNPVPPRRHRRPTPAGKNGNAKQTS